MPYLVAAVTVSTLLSVLTLTLALGLTRRIRVLSTQLATLGQSNDASVSFGRDRVLAPDTVVPEFAAVTTDGEPVSRDLLTGTTLVTFLAPGCAPCETLLPRFLEHAAEFPGGRQQVLAVLTMASPEDCAVYADRLSPVARVVIERGKGPLSDAFEADALPVLYLVGAGGVVRASGVDAAFLTRRPVGASADVR
ncbi:TlpA family protein [Virgisporangium ochraceum]|uniref:TlpA family protein n=1 Tax=Virgisporangium ochraceum TaxID=65505 RepID=A0A8J3ZXN2_9ACTN|nr:redoxin domain-containing protein [Virgisporangium ochraceum]GIJ70807.1 TlpA family protein [Virgisporangium ochraceum]